MEGGRGAVRYQGGVPLLRPRLPCTADARHLQPGAVERERLEDPLGAAMFGCTEPDFPRTALFETRTNMSIPRDVPFGVSKRNYLTLTGVAKTLSVPRLH